MSTARLVQSLVKLALLVSNCLLYFLRVLDQVEEPDVTKKAPNLDQTLEISDDSGLGRQNFLLILSSPCNTFVS